MDSEQNKQTDKKEEKDKQEDEVPGLGIHVTETLSTADKLR